MAHSTYLAGTDDGPSQSGGSAGMPVMPISALAAACRVPDYAESLSNTSAGGARTVFSFGIIRALPGRPTVCHPAGNVLASRRGAQCARALSLSTACPHGGRGYVLQHILQSIFSSAAWRQ